MTTLQMFTYKDLAAIRDMFDFASKHDTSETVTPGAIKSVKHKIDRVMKNTHYLLRDHTTYVVVPVDKREINES